MRTYPYHPYVNLLRCIGTLFTSSFLHLINLTFLKLLNNTTSSVCPTHRHSCSLSPPLSPPIIFSFPALFSYLSIAVVYLLYLCGALLSISLPHFSISALFAISPSLSICLPHSPSSSLSQSLSVCLSLAEQITPGCSCGQASS